jgi:hypothetical protein
VRNKASLTICLFLFVCFMALYCGAANSSSGEGRSDAAPSRQGNPNLTIPYPTDVLTYHYNVFRHGSTLQESVLKPSNVNFNTFGKINFFSTDAKVDAQPLYVNKQFIGGSLNNTVYVVTENASIYAYSAESGRLFWMKTALGQGETASDDHGCGQISPKIGITDTPVIDKSKGPNGVMYFVAMSKDSSGHYHQRLHALDLTTGGEMFGGPTEIQAMYPGTGDGSQNGFVIFNPGQFAERAGILQFGNILYLAFTSHCDIRPYTGWIMGYDARTLQQTTVIDVTPNGREGAIWMAGSGLAADTTGNIYFLVGNGTFDTTLDANGFPVNGDYGNAFMKLSNSGGSLHVVDYFNMFNTVQESNADEDLGSGGAIILPDLMDNQGQVHHLAVGAGKDTHIYVVDRDNMGKWNSSNNNQIWQDIPGALPGGIWSKPAYFNNTVYYGDVSNKLKAFTISNAHLSTSPTSQTSNTFPYPGTIPSVSSSQGSNAIVWAVANSNPAVLHAYDANNLATEFYNSNQAGSRDQFGAGNKFITPIVVNGKVFVGTQTGVAVFGLLP